MAEGVQGELGLEQAQYDDEVDLPDGWCLSTVEEVAWVNPPGKTVSPPDETIVSFLPMPAVEELSGEIDLSDQRPFGSVKKGFTRFREGDLLFAKITPSMENGKIAVARGLKNGMGCGTTEFHVLRPSEAVTVDFLRYFVLRDAYRGEARRHMAGAVGQQRVPKSFLASTEIPLAPLAEQRRIVSRIEELFSKIEAGERAIEQARKALKRYRKAVLKAAVTGALTEDWRDTHPPTETGEALLARILGERREVWEAAQIAKRKSKTKPTERERQALAARYKEPTIPDPQELSDLPDGWIWATVDQLTSHITSGSRDWKPYYDRGSSVFILAGNVRPRKLDLTEIQNVDPPEGDRDAARSAVQKNDLLITIVGANTGDLCRVPLDLERHYVCQSVALMRPVSPNMSKYLEAYLSSEGAGRTQMEKHIYGAGRPHLSFEQLRELVVPLPPIEEQPEIVSRVEEALSRADAAEAALDEQARAARALRQSILKAAFTGRLVPQDPNDEPASELLKRVKESAT